MTDKWIIQDIEKQITHRNRVVIIDPAGDCAYLLPYIEKRHYTILKTDAKNTEEWQRIQEELLLRYEAESKHKADKVIFYVTRPKEKLSFLVVVYPVIYEVIKLCPSNVAHNSAKTLR